MKLFKQFKSSLIVFTVCIWSLIVLCSNVSGAPFSASMEILDPIVLTETTQLQFGLIQRPSSGTAQYVISPEGVLTDNGDGFFISGQSEGVIAGTGTVGKLVDIEIPPTGPSGPCSIDSGTVPILNNIAVVPVGVAQLPVTLKVGGQITIASDTFGDGSCPYDVTVNYQ